MIDQERILKDAIIKTGKRLYAAGLAVARSGNISARLDSETILITASGAYLGELSYDDIVKVHPGLATTAGVKKPSSELPLHGLVYKNFTEAKTVVHCHPPLVNGYFAVNDTLDALTFETKFYLGQIPVVAQDTPTVTKPEAVIEAFKSNSLVVLKNHGVVAMAGNFDDSLALIEALEEAVKTACVARLFLSGTISRQGETKIQDPSIGAAYAMFSKEHIQAIVTLVNKDAFIAQKGQELDLTVQLAIKLDGENTAFKFNFEKGKIIRLDCDADAPFVISGPAAVWEQVFLGKLDSFVAVTQGKMQLKGALGQLSKWYVPFTRLFELFKQVKIQ